MKLRHRFLLLGVLLVVAMALSIFLGRYPRPYWMPPQLLWEDPLAQRLVLHLRLPRILSAVLLGMVLSAAGFVLQMLFRNPLVEPGFLGVSQGAAFGAALGIIVIGASPLVLQAMAALFALLGLVFSSALARYIRFGGWTLRLILAGIAVSALFAAGVGLLKYVADPLTQLPELVFWLLGALWGITWTDTLSILPVAVVALSVTFLMRWRLNLLSLDDQVALSLGTAPARERSVLLVVVVAATAAVVSVAGIVGWVGLIIPQLARRLFGADAQRALPGSLLLGGLFALICDDIARVAFVGELPLGILTSLFGALLFAVVMVAPRRWERRLSTGRATASPETGAEQGLSAASPPPVGVPTADRVAPNAVGVSLANVVFSYEGQQRTLFEGLSLEIPAGRVTAILGPNGSGKTTLLHLVLGILAPETGAVLLAHRRRDQYTRGDLGRLIGLVSQNEYIPFNFTVLEYVLLGRAPHLQLLQTPGDGDIRAARQVLAETGLSHLEHRSIQALSGGERQLVMVARALAQHPRILLLDEPTSHLDLSNKGRVLSIIAQQAASGVTVAFTTHEPDLAAACAGFVVLMRGGQILDAGPAASTLTSTALSRTYGVRVEVGELNGRRIVVGL